MVSTPAFLPGEFHGQGSLVGYGPWDHKELDTTEHTAQRSINRQMDTEDVIYIYIYTHTQWNITQLLKKKDEIMPFGATRIDLETTAK